MSDKPDRVEFYRHSVGDEEVAAVTEALGDIFLTTGARVKQFELALADYLGGGIDVLGLSSCTAALHLALLGFDIGPGDEVITSPMTFVASANAILYAGATPVFVDVEPTTGNLDVAQVSAAVTPRTKAVVCVHLYGQLCDMRALRELCDRHDLRLIEDAAHAVDGLRDGVRPGQLGDAAAFSFHAVKNITSAEGGAIAVRDSEVFAKLRPLSLHGQSAGADARYASTYRHWDMVTLGYKYNLTNLQAAMLLPQLARVDRQRDARERLAHVYEQAFADVDGIEFPRVVDGATSGRHLFTIWVPAADRDRYLTELGERGIGVAVNYRAIHLLSYYQQRLGHLRGSFPVAESIGDRTISIPLYPSLRDDEQQRVIEAVLAVHRVS